MEQLLTELLHLVLGEVPDRSNASLVCKRWREQALRYRIHVYDYMIEDLFKRGDYFNLRLSKLCMKWINYRLFIRLACEHGVEDLVDLLHNNDKKLMKDNDYMRLSLVSVACKNGHLKIVDKYWLFRDVNVLHAACESGQIDVYNHVHKLVVTENARTKYRKNFNRVNTDLNARSIGIGGSAEIAKLYFTSGGKDAYHMMIEAAKNKHGLFYSIARELNCICTDDEYRTLVVGSGTEHPINIMWSKRVPYGQLGSRTLLDLLKIKCDRAHLHRVYRELFNAACLNGSREYIMALRAAGMTIDETTCDSIGKGPAIVFKGLIPIEQHQIIILNSAISVDNVEILHEFGLRFHVDMSLYLESIIKARAVHCCMYAMKKLTAEDLMLAACKLQSLQFVIAACKHKPANTSLCFDELVKSINTVQAPEIIEYVIMAGYSPTEDQIVSLVLKSRCAGATIGRCIRTLRARKDPSLMRLFEQDKFVRLLSNPSEVPHDSVLCLLIGDVAIDNEVAEILRQRGLTRTLENCIDQNMDVDVNRLFINECNDSSTGTSMLEMLSNFKGVDHALGLSRLVRQSKITVSRVRIVTRYLVGNDKYNE